MSDFINTVPTFLSFEPDLVGWPMGVYIVILFSFRFLISSFRPQAYSLPMVWHSSASVGLSDCQAYQRASTQ